MLAMAFLRLLWDVERRFLNVLRGNATRYRYDTIATFEIKATFIHDISFAAPIIDRPARNFVQRLAKRLIVALAY